MTLSRPAAENPFLSKEIAAPSNDWCLPPEPVPLKFGPTLYFHYCWARGFVFLPLLYLMPQSFNLSIQNHGLCLSFKSCRLSFNLALKILKTYLDALIKKVPVCMCTIHVWSVGLAAREKGRFSHTTSYSSFPSQWRLADIFWSFSQSNNFFWCQLYFCAEIEAIPSTLFQPSSVSAKIPKFIFSSNGSKLHKIQTC